MIFQQKSFLTGEIEVIHQHVPYAVVQEIYLVRLSKFGCHIPEIWTDPPDHEGEFQNIDRFGYLPNIDPEVGRYHVDIDQAAAIVCQMLNHPQCIIPELLSMYLQDILLYVECYELPQ